MDIGEILFKQGHVDGATLEKARETGAREAKEVGAVLLEAGIVTEAVLREARALELALKTEQYEDRRAFLEGVIPFNALSDLDRGRAAQTLAWKSFVPGETIIRQGAPGTQFYLIRSGLVKVFLEQEGREVVLGFLGEGDCFGEMSLLTGAPTSATVETVEHTLCLVQGRDDFLSLVGDYPLFQTFFNQLLTQRMKTVYKELLTATPGISQVEPYLYRKQVRDLISPQQAFCKDAISLIDAAREIVEKGAPALIVTDEQGSIRGIVGQEDILKAVVLEGKDPGDPVGTIANTQFHSIDGSSYFFDALHDMVKHRAGQLVVMEKKKARGIVTGFDLLRFRGREVLSLVRNIEEAQDLAELDRMRREVEKVLRALMTDGALASNACKIVSELNDKIVRQVVQLAEGGLGSPPSPYTWLGLGSEGRREQTLLTDQDNALIFADEATPERLAYFGELSQRVVDGLNQCGFPLCKGEIMATNPKYFGTLGDWKKRTSGWIAGGSLPAKELIDIYVFLDFRGVFGSPALEEALREHVIGLIRQSPAFAQALAANIVSIPVPLGFFKNFVVEKSGQYKNTVNLKTHGLLPLTTCVKLMALHLGMHDTNTLERVRGLAERGVFTEDQAEFLEQAFETFLTLKIRNNLSDVDKGRDFSNHIDPAGLTTRQKQLLKEAFLAVSQVQKVAREYLRVSE